MVCRVLLFMWSLGALGCLAPDVSQNPWLLEASAADPEDPDEPWSKLFMYSLVV